MLLPNLFFIDLHILLPFLEYSTWNKSIFMQQMTMDDDVPAL